MLLKSKLTLKLRKIKMKKLTLILSFTMLFFSNAIAFDGIKGVNVGLSLSGGVFDVDGAKEEFKGNHVGAQNPGNITKKSTEDTAEGLFAIGSVFAELQINDVIGIGIDYVPHSLESETTENVQTDGGASKTNKVQVDFTKLATLYATASHPIGVYAKVGYVEVDVETNENLGTGGAYGDTSLDGYTVALGYQREIQNDAFVRIEANYMELDGATLTNSNDSTKSITADGITGYGAKLSIGKSF